MVNYIWLSMILLGVFTAAWNGRIEVVVTSALEGAQSAVTIAFGLIAVMAFWLGILKIAEQAGLVRALAVLVRPLVQFLFPGVPRDHPAVGAMVMNLSANIMGLSSAATPMGLVAMRELQRLNPAPERASDAMCTFLAMNTGCLTLIPSVIIGIRALYGSADPTAVVGPTIFATGCGMTAAILADRFFRRLYKARGD